jgi:hypothetical protein
MALFTTFPDHLFSSIPRPARTLAPLVNGTFGNTQPRSGTLRHHSHDGFPLLNRHNDVSQINEALIIDFLRSHIIKRNIVLQVDKCLLSTIHEFFIA